MKVFSKNKRAGAGPPPASHEMSLMEHLQELRSRLFKITGAYAVTATISWFLYKPVLKILTDPLKAVPLSGQIISKGKLIFTAPPEAFFIRVKITAFLGLLLALPVILWQLWRFVTPGLYKNEKRYVAPFVAVAMALFSLGVWVAFLSLPPALKLLTGIGGKDLVLLPKAADYLSFVMLLIAAFGFSFEFPVVIIGFVVAGVLSAQTLRKVRRMAWVGILFFAAVVTPTTDPITMLLMAIPMLFLYEGTIVAAWLITRKKRTKQANESS